MYEYRFPCLSYNSDNNKFEVINDSNVYQIDEITINTFNWCFQYGMRDNDYFIECFSSNENDLLLLPPNWYIYQIQLLVKELNSDEMFQPHTRYNIDALWKLLSAKWFGVMATVCMLEQEELSETIIEEYNKHIGYMNKELIIRPNSTQEIRSMLRNNITYFESWNDDKILEIMNGGHLQRIKVPNWASMFSVILTNHFERIKHISVAKVDNMQYYYSLSGKDYGLENSTQPTVVNRINETFSNSGISTNPIRCYLTDDVIYSIDGHNDLTYRKYRLSAQNAENDRMFTCTERKIMAKIQNNERVMIVSGWEPCYMCTRVNFKYYQNINMLGLENHNPSVSQIEYDDIALEIISHP